MIHQILKSNRIPFSEISFQTFLEGVDRALVLETYESRVAEWLSEILRPFVVSPGRSIVFRLRRELTLKEMMKLILFSWYLPPVLIGSEKFDFGELLRTHLEEYLRGKFKEFKDLKVLDSKINTLSYIYLSGILGRTENEFYGQIRTGEVDSEETASAFLNSLSIFRFKVENPRPARRTQRKRGYSDKGHLAPEDRLLPEELPNYLSQEEIDRRNFENEIISSIFEDDSILGLRKLKGRDVRTHLFWKLSY